MLYAVVDIETTGGYASAGGITEVAINVHDGTEVLERFSTLINPEKSIPPFITALTGIDSDMIADAPKFFEVASKIFELLNNKVFIAHNVNFDYSFLKHHLAYAGYDLQCKKLCTVRLSRIVFPGKQSYSLGKLCNSLNIPLLNRHRAAGDADATSTLFNLLLEHDQEGIIAEMLKKSSKEQVLPPNLDKKTISKLPESPGVYYFKDKKGKIIYVGKAKSLKKRVTSHFTGNRFNKQRQDFLREIFYIDHTICGTELMALILEANEIKRLWPTNNKAMKRYEPKYDLCVFEDQKGYLRLGIDKHKKNYNAIHSFNNLLSGYNFITFLIENYQLCAKLCCVQQNAKTCITHISGQCFGSCSEIETVSVYNRRVENALEDVKQNQPNFALLDHGRTAEECSCLVVEHGKFYGMGYLKDKTEAETGLANFKEKLSLYNSNDYIVNLILNHAAQNPTKLLKL